MKRHSVVAALLLASQAALPNFSLASDAPRTGTITISGKGFGHGVGMAQDGDLALGKLGKSMPQILGTFYPGTRFATLTEAGSLRVAVEQVAAAASVVVQLPAGGSARVGKSGVSIRPGGSVRLTHTADAYVATLIDPPSSLRRDQRTATGTLAYDVYSPGPEVIPATDRSYHGSLSAVIDGPVLRAINTVPLETYLDGLGEVLDPSWPAASLQALAVAARTYAVHSLHPAAIFDVWDDDRSQVYLGAGSEYPQLTAAVTATRDLVLTYDGAVADTVYSASGGGITATAAEGFGDSPEQMADEPYLVAATYPTANPQPWSITLSLATVAVRLGYPGTMTAMRVTAAGPSGRPTSVTLSGSAGPKVVSGIDLYDNLDLRSTLFTLAPDGATTPATHLPNKQPATTQTAPAQTVAPTISPPAVQPTTVHPMAVQPPAVQPPAVQPTTGTPARSTPQPAAAVAAPPPPLNWAAVIAIGLLLFLTTSLVVVVATSTRPRTRDAA